MKVIGTNETGGVIIEFERNEYLELEKLCHAVEGSTINDVLAYYPPNSPYKFSFPGKLDSVYAAIRAFYEAKYAVNELKMLVGNLDQVIMGDFNVSDS